MDDEIVALTGQIEALKMQLTEARRRRSPEPVPDFELIDGDGSVHLSQLFAGHDDLLVVHNMGRGCAYCTLWADGFNGLLDHLQDRAAVVVASPDDPATQAAFAASRGWRFRM